MDASMSAAAGGDSFCIKSASLLVADEPVQHTQCMFLSLTTLTVQLMSSLQIAAKEGTIKQVVCISEWFGIVLTLRKLSCRCIVCLFAVEYSRE